MGEASAAAGRRSRTPSAEVERELVAAAEAVLVRDGPGAVTVRAVAAEAGSAPMSVYNRFGGKDGLVYALLIIGFDRLRAAIESSDEPQSSPGGTTPSGSTHGASRGTPPDPRTPRDELDRLRACGVRYREFALANPHFYAIMFEDAIPHEHVSPQVEEHAGAAFGALVRQVELAAAAGRILAPDPTETAQQIWSAVHGAVALELKGLVLTPDAAATYRACLATMLRGLAPS